MIPNYTIAAEKRKHVYLAQNELPLLNSKEPRRGDFRQIGRRIEIFIYDFSAGCVCRTALALVLLFDTPRELGFRRQRFQVSLMQVEMLFLFNF